MPKVEEELKRMEEAGIIERVTGQTEWCALMVPVQKRNGKLRICVNLRKLNSAVNHARFVLPTLEDIAPKLAGAQYFSKLDVPSGFWQIPLYPDSAKLTTFITPSGWFCFKRLPFGITCALEIFQCLMTPRNFPVSDDRFAKGRRRLWSDHGWHYCAWKVFRGAWWQLTENISNY